MKKASVYTKSGDSGTTGLVGGTRVKKSDARIHLYGEVDELNSFIGLGISHLPSTINKDFLLLIQSALFDIGSNLACEKDKRSDFKLPKMKAKTIEKLEEEIDKMDLALSPLKNFILPGGTVSSSTFHLCRTICRRVERQMVHFEENHPGEIPSDVLKFMNRLSDYFFILARFCNKELGVSDQIWVAEI